MTTCFLEGINPRHPGGKDEAGTDIFIGEAGKFDSALHFLVQSMLHKIEAEGDDPKIELRGERSAYRFGYFRNPTTLDKVSWADVYSRFSVEVKNCLPENSTENFIEGVSFGFPYEQLWEIMVQTSEYWIRLSYDCGA